MSISGLCFGEYKKKKVTLFISCLHPICVLSSARTKMVSFVTSYLDYLPGRWFCNENKEWIASPFHVYIRSMFWWRKEENCLALLCHAYIRSVFWFIRRRVVGFLIPCQYTVCVLAMKKKMVSLLISYLSTPGLRFGQAKKSSSFRYFMSISGHCPGNTKKVS